MRNLTLQEASLIEKLLSDANIEADVTTILVTDMVDGGMGSLLIGSGEGRRLGKGVASYEFEDIDGVLVSVVLNVDQNGDLFELDVWKVDFSPTKRLGH